MLGASALAHPERTFVAFTGHRPDKLGGYTQAAERRLTAFASRVLSALAEQRGPLHVISGMALGWDMAVAEAACELQIPYTAAVPFPQQPDRWPMDSKKRWRSLCDRAAAVEVLEQTYSAAGLQRRNIWMVDNANLLIALWNGSDGGTANCVRYARSVGLPVLQAWNKWGAFGEYADTDPRTSPAARMRA